MGLNWAVASVQSMKEDIAVEKDPRDIGIPPFRYPAGELICPAYHELCSTVPVSMNGQCPSSCSFNGDCVDGKCHCFLGFHGHDCSKRKFITPGSLGDQFLPVLSPVPKLMN